MGNQLKGGKNKNKNGEIRQNHSQYHGAFSHILYLIKTDPQGEIVLECSNFELSFGGRYWCQISHRLTPVSRKYKCNVSVLRHLTHL